MASAGGLSAVNVGATRPFMTVSVVVPEDSKNMVSPE